MFDQWTVPPASNPAWSSGYISNRCSVKWSSRWDVCCCVRPTQSLQFWSAWILSEIPQLLSSYFHLPSRRSVSVFVSQPPSVQIYLSITWAWWGSVPGRGVAGYFLSYFDSENVSICWYYVGFRCCLRSSFPWGNGSFLVARRLIDAASLCLCGVCTDALADGVRLRHWSWSGEQVDRVPQPHSCFPLCFPSAMRC